MRDRDVGNLAVVFDYSETNYGIGIACECGRSGGIEEGRTDCERFTLGSPDTGEIHRSRTCEE